VLGWWQVSRGKSMKLRWKTPVQRRRYAVLLQVGVVRTLEGAEVLGWAWIAEQRPGHQSRTQIGSRRRSTGQPRVGERSGGSSRKLIGSWAPRGSKGLRPWPRPCDFFLQKPASWHFFEFFLFASRPGEFLVRQSGERSFFPHHQHHPHMYALRRIILYASLRIHTSAASTPSPNPRNLSNQPRRKIKISSKITGKQSHACVCHAVLFFFLKKKKKNKKQRKKTQSGTPDALLVYRNTMHPLPPCALPGTWGYLSIHKK